MCQLWAWGPCLGGSQLGCKQAVQCTPTSYFQHCLAADPARCRGKHTPVEHMLY